ncbi:unnamed protein product [Sphagnum troendelagicum]|uniref:Uncharacterized protein n=1 Tax=Sphagnum troendelagicum TaxID=128251 RepID=A0ABP0TP35_9BRYO
MEIEPEDGSKSVDFGLENGVRKAPSSCGRRRRRRRAVCRSGEKRKMCADKAIKTARYKSNLSKCSVIGAMYSQEGNADGAYTQVLSLLYSLRTTPR